MRHLRTFFVCIIFIAFGSVVSAQGIWTTYKPFSEEGSIFPNWFLAIAFGLNDDVWFGGPEGVARLKSGVWTTFTEDNSPVGGSKSIAISPDGTVWSGGAEGVYRLEGGVWTTFTEDDGLVGGYVSDMAIGPDGTVWACGSEWLYMYNDGIWIPSTPDNAPTNLSFGKIAVDSDGVVWLAASSNGVYMYYDGLWMKFTEEDGLASGLFNSIAIDYDGMVWVGGLGGIIVQFNGETWTTILEGDYTVRSLNNYHKDSMNYLNTIINKEQDYYSAHGEYVDFDFGEDCEPIEWTAAIKKYFEFSFQDSIAVAREVEDINRDGDTDDGLTLSISNIQGIIEGSNLTWAPLFEGPKGYDVYAIAFEQDGVTWFGTNNGGVHKYYDGTWELYTTEDGLVDNTVWDVDIAPDGAVWVATSSGISKFVPSITIVEENKDTPSEFAVTGNFPNPFNPETCIQFTLPDKGMANLSIYNITGQKVRELVADRMQAGTHSVIWDGKDDSGNAVSSGIYLSRLKSGEHVAANRMLLLK